MKFIKFSRYLYEEHEGAFTAILGIFALILIITGLVGTMTVIFDDYTKFSIMCVWVAGFDWLVLLIILCRYVYKSYIKFESTLQSSQHKVTRVLCRGKVETPSHDGQQYDVDNAGYIISDSGRSKTKYNKDSDLFSSIP